MDIIEVLRSTIHEGMVIPKPFASAFVVKGWGIRREESALVYKIPNLKGGKPYEKGITITEWKKVFEHLNKEKSFTRNWFDKNLSPCAKEGGCNFTTIGGIFELLGIAKYEPQALYRLIEK